jgi:hypothetical protein
LSFCAWVMPAKKRPAKDSIRAFFIPVVLIYIV